MNDFDKVAYWKKRAMDEVKREFENTVLLMKNVRQTLFHITGQDLPDLERLITEIGDTYDELAELIKEAEPAKKKEKSKIIVVKK